MMGNLAMMGLFVACGFVGAGLAVMASMIGMHPFLCYFGAGTSGAAICLAYISATFEVDPNEP